MVGLCVVFRGKHLVGGAGEEESWGVSECTVWWEIWAGEKDVKGTWKIGRLEISNVKCGVMFEAKVTGSERLIKKKAETH